MSEIDYIGSDELIFNNDKNSGIYSGGFSVNSIMMKSKMSPIMTLNNNSINKESDKVSDLFNDLVVPNWTLTYNNRITGGKYNQNDHENSDSDDDIINDDLHDKLLDLVKEHNVKEHNGKTENKKRMTRRMKNLHTKKVRTKKRM